MLRDSKYKISISISWKVGLDKLSMLLRKKSFGTRINHRLYCSQGTKMFILKMFPLTPDKCLASLTPHEPHMVHVYDGQEIYTLVSPQIIARDLSCSCLRSWTWTAML